MARIWGANGPGGKDYKTENDEYVIAGVKFLDDIKPGCGTTMTEIFAALRAAGYGNLVEATVLLRNRQETTRSQLEIALRDLKEEGEEAIASDVDILILYALGWMGPLKDRLEERISQEAIRKKDVKKFTVKKKTKNEPIDFSKGDPVKLMHPGETK